MNEWKKQKELRGGLSKTCIATNVQHFQPVLYLFSSLYLRTVLEKQIRSCGREGINEWPSGQAVYLYDPMYSLFMEGYISL